MSRDGGKDVPEARAPDWHAQGAHPSSIFSRRLFYFNLMYLILFLGHDGRVSTTTVGLLQHSTSQLACDRRPPLWSLWSLWSFRSSCLSSSFMSVHTYRADAPSSPFLFPFHIHTMHRLPPAGGESSSEAPIRRNYGRRWRSTSAPPPKTPRRSFPRSASSPWRSAKRRLDSKSTSPTANPSSSIPPARAITNLPSSRCGVFRTSSVLSCTCDIPR